MRISPFQSRRFSSSSISSRLLRCSSGCLSELRVDFELLRGRVGHSDGISVLDLELGLADGLGGGGVIKLRGVSGGSILGAFLDLSLLFCHFYR